MSDADDRMPFFKDPLVLGMCAVLVAVVWWRVVGAPFQAASQALAPQPPAPASPLDQAAPEVPALRPQLKALLARLGTPALPGRSERGAYPAACRGKALIAELSSGDISEAHKFVSDELRPRALTGDFTLFLIVNRERAFEADYVWDPLSPHEQEVAPTGVKGYRNNTELAAIQLPERQLLGYYFVYGSPPPTSVRIGFGQTVVDGEWMGPVAHWVEGAMRGERWRRWDTVPRPSAGDQSLMDVVHRARVAIPACDGAGGRADALPAKALIWYWNEAALCDFSHGAQRMLPVERQASASDASMTIFFVMDEKLATELDGEGRTIVRQHFDRRLAVITMPGAHAVGTFAVRGVDTNARGEPLDPAGGDDAHRLARWVDQACADPRANLR